MFLLDLAGCGPSGILRVIYFFKLIMNIIFIIIPIVLIVYLTVHFAKAMISGDQNEHKKIMKLSIKRLIYAVILFAVPWIVSVFNSILGELGVDYLSCYNNLTIEAINELEEEEKAAEEEFKNNLGNGYSGNYEDPIDVNGNNVIEKIVTDTLKITIEEYDNYYVTHIWASNPYKQFKSAVPENFGKKLETGHNLLSNDISKRNYNNKAIVAINASGFDGAYSSQSVSHVVIVDGKILRDSTSGYISTSASQYTYGITKDNYLTFYQFSSGTNLKSNRDQVNKMVDDGILYTFSFRPRLVIDGKLISGLQKGNNIRQGFCQIDKNNFVFITNKSSRSKGFTLSGLGQYMIDLGCKTGFNLDGGGSTYLLLKKSGSNSITTIVDADKEMANSSRKIADIIYFHE